MRVEELIFWYWIVIVYVVGSVPEKSSCQAVKAWAIRSFHYSFVCGPWGALGRVVVLFEILEYVLRFFGKGTEAAVY